MELHKLYTLDAHNTGAEIRVKDQFGNDTDFYITVLGVDSSTWRNTLVQAQRGAVETGEMMEPNEVLARCTVGWRGLTLKGKPVPFTKEAAKALYINAPYIADQVDQFMGKRKNFTTG